MCGPWAKRDRVVVQGPSRWSIRCSGRCRGRTSASRSGSRAPVVDDVPVMSTPVAAQVRGVPGVWPGVCTTRSPPAISSRSPSKGPVDGDRGIAAPAGLGPSPPKAGSIGGEAPRAGVRRRPRWAADGRAAYLSDPGDIAGVVGVGVGDQHAGDVLDPEPCVPKAPLEAAPRPRHARVDQGDLAVIAAQDERVDAVGGGHRHPPDPGGQQVRGRMRATSPWGLPPPRAASDRAAHAG